MAKPKAARPGLHRPGKAAVPTKQELRKVYAAEKDKKTPTVGGRAQAIRS